MVSEIDFQLLALAWVACLSILFWVLRRNPRKSIGLPIAFFFATAFEYIGGFAYAVPGYDHIRAGGELYLLHKNFTSETVYAGLQLTTIGISALVFGVVLMARRSSVSPRPGWIRQDEVRTVMSVLSCLTAVGFITMFIRLPIPMIDAFAQIGRNAAIALICLGATLAFWRKAPPHVMLKWFALGSLIPAAYLFGWGFMSYGFLAFTSFAGFFGLRLTRTPPRLYRFVGLTLAVSYLLLSIFVAYMSFRDELRKILWSNAGLGDRINSVVSSFGNITWLNPFDFSSLDWLVIRLNQSMYIGKMIEYHATHENLRLYGESLILAFVAFVPRFIWPDKPELGGSEFMSRHTGMTFASGATFGTGPVFEFYVNFGTIGVICGMFALGLVIAWIDERAGSALSQGRLWTYARWTTVGLALVRPLSDFFFLVNTAIASLIVFWAIGKVLPLKSSIYSKQQVSEQRPQ